MCVQPATESCEIATVYLLFCFLNIIVQCDKRIKVKQCPAYEVTKLKNMNMEENPSYEEVKSLCSLVNNALNQINKMFIYAACDRNINMNRCTAYEATKLAREELPMEQNPAYGEIGITCM